MGWIENGDWIEYRVTVERSGIHEFVFRVATQTNGGSIDLSLNGASIGTAAVDPTKSSGWQDWFTTEPVQADLPVGTHTLRLAFRGGSGYLFNLNWFDVVLVSATGKEDEDGIGQSLQLLPPYPNPFRSSAIIPFQVAEAGSATLSVFNVLGQRIVTLTDGIREPGMHFAEWDGTLSAGGAAGDGIYYVRMESGGQVLLRPLAMAR